jgi:hypothetical protein
MKRYAFEINSIHDIPPAATDAKRRADLQMQYAGVVRRAKMALDDAEATRPSVYVSERVRKLRDVTEYLDLWFQIECDRQRLAVLKSLELQKRILANIDRSLALSVVRCDDACGYRTATGVLTQIRSAVSAVKCVPAKSETVNGK